MTYLVFCWLENVKMAPLFFISVINCWLSVKMVGDIKTSTVLTIQCLIWCYFRIVLQNHWKELSEQIICISFSFMLFIGSWFFLFAHIKIFLFYVNNLKKCVICLFLYLRYQRKNLAFERKFLPWFNLEHNITGLATPD